MTLEDRIAELESQIEKLDMLVARLTTQVEFQHEDRIAELESQIEKLAT